MAKRKKKAVSQEYSFLAIEITSYKAVVEAAINYEVRDLRRCDGDEKIYRFDSRLEIEGFCTYPENREGDVYSITIYGAEFRDGQFSSMLKDYHVQDENWHPVYKNVHGKEIPVYDVPRDIGMLDRQRGTKSWNGWLWVSPRTVSDMLALLPHVRPLYLEIHELCVGRKHWVAGLTLQTTDPAEN